MDYKVHDINNGKKHPKRGVAFLVSDKDKKVTAKAVFDSLDKNEAPYRGLMTGFEAWQGCLVNKKRFHGWNKTEYKGRYTKCFVFKHNKHHFYGFLCNPKENNIRYEACILVRHTNKTEWQTDETDLKQVEELRSNIPIQNLIRQFYKEK